MGESEPWEFLGHEKLPPPKRLIIQPSWSFGRLLNELAIVESLGDPSP
jgi:hypothetical protein